jgi:hypothetical protein
VRRTHFNYRYGRRPVEGILPLATMRLLQMIRHAQVVVMLHKPLGDHQADEILQWAWELIYEERPTELPDGIRPYFKECRER